jgi:hypothetical protein
VYPPLGGRGEPSREILSNDLMICSGLYTGPTYQLISQRIKRLIEIEGHTIIRPITR